MLRSAVGKTHVLRSRLVMNYTTSHFPFRLYSEIDHIHLSSEAQCVSHLLPPGDCHNLFPYFTPSRIHIHGTTSQKIKLFQQPF